jgi:NADP-dependent 3-hydroxy acid dehydrogenase YdfG
VTGSVSHHQAIYWELVYSAPEHALQAARPSRRRLVGSGLRRGDRHGRRPQRAVLVTDKAKIEDGVARGIGLRSEDIPEAVAFMLTRPQCVTIRDLVILARNQEI